MLPASIRRRVTMLTGLTLVAALYVFARLPVATGPERAALATRFQFQKASMPEIAGPPQKSVRAVQASLKRINAWISAVGAGVAIADLDGDGLANDFCRTEPRTDQVIISSAPGFEKRYPSFTLEAPDGPYKPGTTAPMGCLGADLNEDGLMDILVYYWGRTPVAFLRKTGTPGVAMAISPAAYEPYEIVPTGERWFTNAAFVTDLDGDGHLDIMIGNYFQDGAEILDSSAGARQSMHNTKSRADNGGKKHLLLWESATSGDHPSVHVREPADLFDQQTLHGWTLGAGAADLDGDGLPEIYFANDFGADRLLHNRSTPGHPRFATLVGKRGFTTPASFQFGRDSFKGMGLDFGDVNGDGLLDIYVSNIADEYALNESHFLWLSNGKIEQMKEGIAPYVQASEGLGLSRSGWGWDTRLADFDNDGVLEAIQATGFLKGSINRWPELQALGTGNDQLMENPDHWPGFRPNDDVSGRNLMAFFVKDSGGRFQNINVEVGLDRPMVSRGIAVADVDGDGRLDFAVANQWETSYFFRNASPGSGPFLGLHLLLPLGREQEFRTRPGHPGQDLWGRPAIGAVAKVRLASGRILTAQADGGSGHSGKRSPDIHMGLGRNESTESVGVEIRWRDTGGKMQQKNLTMRPGWHTVLLGHSKG